VRLGWNNIRRGGGIAIAFAWHLLAAAHAPAISLRTTRIYDGAKCVWATIQSAVLLQP